MLSRPAISYSAEATSNACARLSSWQGPARSEIGRSLPNLTDPIPTTEAAEVLVFKLSSFRRAHQIVRERSSSLDGLKGQGCSIGHLRRYHQPSLMAMRSNPVVAVPFLGPIEVIDLKAESIQQHPLAAQSG